ncbi:MAG: hypothetical protein IBX72_06935 [Nitrospirae bacterium]|jgi:hypothetical protein|nr:hypothetical protein [Nitrospirota bacterium]
MSENEVFEKFVKLVKDHEADGGRFEDLFDCDPVKKKYKLKRQYTMSDSALKQRRENAKKPRRRGDDIDLLSSVIEKLTDFRDRLNQKLP